ncbi:MAG: helix-turn-helix domain-containing protein [Planctomycetes bacterium]|nr:helix-turn-helix domain-containing protein [Planctomycetota bacterium]
MDTSTPTAPRTEALALTLREAAAALGLSPRTIWSLANRRALPVVRVGRRLLFPRDALLRWLERQAEVRS